MCSQFQLSPGWEDWERQSGAGERPRDETFHATYTYDAANRLTVVTGWDSNVIQYGYDDANRMTSATLLSSTGIVSCYTYDDADRITQVQPPSPASAIAYTWDDNGNLVERGSDTFEWDYEDRMVEATVNSVTSTFAYRGDGLRDSRTVGMTTTTFTWDINAGLPVVLDDGSQYLYGAGLSAMKQSGDWYYYLADGLGSTMAVVDASGAVQKSYQYDVYGEPTVTGSLANEFDFAGQETDGSTGLQYLRARYYDPETGVFLSRDPLERLPGWTGNAHGYGAANPANFSDPTGLIPVDGCEPTCQVSAGPAGWFAPDGRWFERRGDDYYLCGMPDARIYNPAQPYCDKFDPAKVAAKTSACELCDEVLLAGVGATWRIGEYTFTGSAQYGRDRMKAYRWTNADLDRIKGGTRYRDMYGNRVYSRPNRDGTWDWLVEREDGYIVSVTRGADVSQLRQARRGLGWTIIR